MRFRIAFRTTRERRSREPVKTLFHSICVRPRASTRPWVPSDGSRAPAWTCLRAYPRKPGRVRQETLGLISTVTQPRTRTLRTCVDGVVRLR